LASPLLGVLWQEIQNDNQVNTLIDNENRISLESPADLQDNNSVRLSIYLYRIVEDASMKNRFPRAGQRRQRAQSAAHVSICTTW
jgi:hypothetical protein